MDIHKPKPVHGWREFLKEVGIIVLGILIALVLEQAVSWAHDRSVGREARASIRGEIAHNLRTVAMRDSIEPCIQRRLREVDRYLDQAQMAGTTSRISWIGAPLSFLASHTKFQAAQSAGRFVFIDEGEQDQIAMIYSDLQDADEAGVREWYAWAELRSLATTHARLTQADLSRLRGALQEARGADWFIRLDDKQVMDAARKLGLSAPHVGSSNGYQVASACLSTDTPFAEGAARASSPMVPFPE
jgi:hypothetical protein